MKGVKRLGISPIYKMMHDQQQDSEERRNKTRILQIEIIKKPKNFSETLEFKIKTDLPDSETVGFAIMDSDSILSDKPDKEDPALVINKSLRLGSTKYTTIFTEDMQKKAFKDVEFDSAECYIKVFHPKIGTAYSEIFIVEEYDFKNKKPVPKKENKNLRKSIVDLKPSLNLYNFLKEMESLRNTKYDDNGNITKMFPYPSPEGGSPTIGWGHKLKKGENFDNGITLEQAEKLLQEDVIEEGVDKLLAFTGDKKINVKLNQQEYDAVISAVFNNGYGETLAASINQGFQIYTKNPETIYKGFLKRVYYKNPQTHQQEKSDGLVKRRAREADIFIKNQWHSYGLSDEKFKTEKEYINAYKKFLDNGILPIIFLIFLSLFSCTPKSEKVEVNKLKTNNLKIDTISVSDSCELALKRIKTFDDGIGNNSQVIENYEKEKKSYLEEINIIYEKLLLKTKKESSEESSQNLIKYHKEWQAYLKAKQDYEVEYIRNYYKSGEYIFYLKPFFEGEYKSKLLEYYSLYEIDKD